MKRRLLPFLALLAGVAAGPAWAEDRKGGNPEDEAALLKKAQAFVEAFHKGDAEAVAGFWTPDGDYITEDDQHLQGREAIEKLFKRLFAENKDLKLRIDIGALRFVTPDVAVEDGTTSVIPPNGAPPSRTRYTAIHVKKNGEWFISSIRDAPFFAPNNEGHLHGLAWAIGDWAEENDKGETARVSFAWSEGQNFIVSTFATTFKDIAIGGGTQYIGWDPLAKKIRSWTFETNGGFGEGTWSKDGKKWVIKATGVLRDGKKLSATNILTPIDANTFSFQAVDRTEDGKELPPIKEIKLKRVQ